MCRQNDRKMHTENGWSRIIQITIIIEHEITLPRKSKGK